MKLAVLTCGMLPIPAVQGGAVENLIDFYLEYNNKKRQHDITIYSPWDPKVSNHPALTSDINHYIFIDVTSWRARISRRIYGYLHQEGYYNYFIEYYFEKVYSDIKKKKFDCIILENSIGFAYKLVMRGHKNIILHMHNGLRESKSKYNKVIFKNLKKVLTVSDYINKEITAQFPIVKTKTVYNGIDTKIFTHTLMSSVKRQEIGFTDQDFIIVYNGRIIKEKGISELIDAMILLNFFPQIKLMVIGSTFFNTINEDDDFLSYLKNKAKKIEERICFTGFIPYHEIPNYLKIADIAVLPSMWEEPFGLTVVEAMGVGLPLITTRSGGIPEICEGAAIIVERKDIVRNLTTAILSLYHNPLKRREMSALSIKRSKVFDKKTYSKLFFEAIEET